MRGWAASAIESARAPERTGQTDDQWWHALGPFLDRVFDGRRCPLATRVGTAATEQDQGTFDPEHAFEFGLARLLDGAEAFVARRAPPPTSTSKTAPP